VEYPSTSLVSSNRPEDCRIPKHELGIEQSFREAEATKNKTNKQKIQRLRRGGCFNGTFEELGANIPNSATDEPA
jgi:hypothetical protein